MDKLYKHTSIYDEIFAGKYTIFFMIGIAVVMYVVPWRDIYSISWYNDLIKLESIYFPNINKIVAQLGAERSEYFVAQQAFINIVEWPLFVYVLYRIKPADKVISGEFTRVYFVLFMGVILIIGSIYIMTSAGTTGGKLTNALSKSDFGLTVMRVVGIWGGFLGWVMFLSTMIGIFKKHRSVHDEN
jgi:hypothetical protein